MTMADELSKILTAMCEEEFKDTVDEVFTTMKELCPVDKGNLRDSITVEHKDPETALIGVDEDALARKGRKRNYAPYVVKGTKPHRIPKTGEKTMKIPIETLKEPVRNPSLVKDGKLVVRHVNHPGNGPNDFIQKTLDKVSRKD